jgi:hypothetical protein
MFVEVCASTLNPAFGGALAAARLTPVTGPVAGRLGLVRR